MDDLLQDMVEKGLVDLEQKADDADWARARLNSWIALFQALRWCELAVNGSEIRKRMN